MVDISKYAGSEPPQSIDKSTWQHMLTARRWLVWKEVSSGAAGVKPRKVPYYPDDLTPREKTDSPEDTVRLGSYGQIIAICRGNKNFRPGFALGPDGNQAIDGHPLAWQGYDRDGALITVEEARDVFQGGYFEISPSGNGAHWIGYGRLFKSKTTDIRGYNEEYYSFGRYFSVSHNQIWDGPIIDMYDRAGTGKPDDKIDHPPQPPVELTEKELKDLRSALRHLSPDPYDNWYRVVLILRGVVGGREIAHEWSSRSDKHRDREFDKKFETVGDPIGYWKSVFSWAVEAGWDPVAEAARGPTKGPFVAIEYSSTVPRPIEYVIDGWVACGSLTISGSAGIGKTSIILPWAVAIAHLTQTSLMTPVVRRDVYYVTEDTGQAERMMYGMRKIGFLDKPEDEVKRWFRIIEASKRSVSDICTELQNLLDNRESILLPGGHEVHPLIVLDTAVSNMEIKDQNSNAELGSYINNIRVAVGKASVWFVTHVSKAAKFGEPEQMSARGGDSWVADTQGEMIIFQDPNEDDVRRAMLGKRRFDPKFTELVCRTETAEESVPVPWSADPQIVRYRAAVVYVESDRTERAKAAEEAKAEEKNNADAIKMMKAVSAFKEDLEKHVTLYFSESTGRDEPPEGSVKVKIDDYLKLARLDRNTDNRDNLKQAMREIVKPVKAQKGYLFRRQEIEDL